MSTPRPTRAMQPTPMTRIHRRLSFTTRLVIFAIAGQCLFGDLQAALQREGDNVVLTDKPRCRFAWPEWDYTNISNPLLLTKNTLDYQALESVMGTRMSILKTAIGSTS